MSGHSEKPDLSSLETGLSKEEVWASKATSPPPLLPASGSPRGVPTPESPRPRPGSRRDVPEALNCSKLPGSSCLFLSPEALEKLPLSGRVWRQSHGRGRPELALTEKRGCSQEPRWPTASIPSISPPSSPLLTSLPGQAKAGFTWAGISHPRASVGQPAALDEKSGVMTDTKLWERRLQEAPWRAGSHRASALLGRESVSSDVTRPLGHQVKHILPDTLHLPASLSFSTVRQVGSSLPWRQMTSGVPYHSKASPCDPGGTVVMTGVGCNSHFWLGQGLQALPGSS